MSGSYRSNSSGPRSEGVSTRLQKIILRRDSRTCQIMGMSCEGGATQVDHIVPVYEGGSDDRDNLQAVCRSCHDEKTQREAQRARAKFSRRRPPTKHPTEGVKSEAEWQAWARAMGK